MIRRKMRLIAVAGLAFMLTFTLVGGAVAAKPETADGARWIVKWEGGVNAAAKDAIIKGAGGVIEMELEHLDMAIVLLPDVRRIEKEKGVLWVEADSYRYYHLQTLPWGIDRIDAEEVWPVNNTGDGVNVAVLDTGIDTDHPDLAANLEGVYSCVNRDTSNVEDRNGHGTHCSGIIAALDNGIGVVGVGPDIDLWMVQISRGAAIRLTDILEGINWCIKTQDTDNPIQVMSMSFGGGYSESEDKALQTAYNAGIVLVSSAGNAYGGAVTYPAALPQVIAVSAVDKYDQIASFSSTGTQVELAAPGVYIYSTYLDGSYETKSGTSMAGPHVAGVAALVIGTGTFTDTNGEYGIADEVRARLQTTAEDIGLTSDKQGHGLVDAENAVLGTTSGNNLPAPPPEEDTAGPVTSNVVADPNPTDGATSVTLTATIDDSTSGNYNIAAAEYFVDSVGADGTGEPMSASDGTFDSPTEAVTAAIEVSGWAVGQYTLYVHGQDAAGNWGATESVVLDVTEAVAPTGIMHVAVMYMWYTTAGPNKFIYTKVNIVDAANVPVPMATVYLKTDLGSTVVWEGTGETNGEGMVTFKLKTRQLGTYTSNVTNVADGWSYDKTKSVELVGDSDGDGNPDTWVGVE